MSPNDAPQPSRRKILTQGINAGLGLLLLPYPLTGQLVERRSLLSLNNAKQPSTSQQFPQGPITATIHLTPKPNQAEALITQLTQALPDARKAPGCRYAQVYVTANNPQTVILFKGWDNPDAQAKYLDWEQSSGKLNKLLELVEGEPIIEYWALQTA